MAPLGVTRPRLTTNPGTGEVPYLSKYTTTTVLDESGKVVPYPYGGTNYANCDSSGGWAETGAFESGSWYSGGWYVRSVGSGLNLWHAGSMPGAFAVLSRTHNGIVLCATFNRREESGSPDFDAFHDELYDAAQAIKTWEGRLWRGR